MALVLAAGCSGDSLSMVTVVFDNVLWQDSAGRPAVAGLETGWGFAVVVETSGSTVLFDTGADGDVLLSNMEALGLSPDSVDAVVLSHRHADHCGGLPELLQRAQPEIFLLQEFADAAPPHLRQVVTAPRTIAPGVLTTGPVAGPLTEQALVVQTEEGPLVICGCAHPGAAAMARAAAEAFGIGPWMVMGGFHMGSASSEEALELAESLESLGVQMVAPTHCTGRLCRSVLRERFGSRFAEGGLGWSLKL